MGWAASSMAWRYTVAWFPMVGTFLVFGDMRGGIRLAALKRVPGDLCVPH